MKQFTENGYCEFPSLLDATEAAHLFAAVQATRKFDESLFMTEEEWENSPKSHRNTNPGPGNNILEKLQGDLGFVEGNSSLQSQLETLLGRGFKWYSKKLVCRLPKTAIPGWLQEKLRGRPSNTLGAFMHPRYRDISYYFDNDVHQDILEWPRMPQDNREHRIVTLYIYLHPVTMDHSPVALLPGTHRFGATPFQHDLTRSMESDRWTYRDGRGRQTESDFKILTGGPGYAALWHSCLLHGGVGTTRPDCVRISLRYILGRSKEASHCLLDEINEKIEGPLYLEADFNPGANSNQDGTWNLRPNDFLNAYKGR